MEDHRGNAESHSGAQSGAPDTLQAPRPSVTDLCSDFDGEGELEIEQVTFDLDDGGPDDLDDGGPDDLDDGRPDDLDDGAKPKPVVTHDLDDGAKPSKH
jgi:hypothetical protein